MIGGVTRLGGLSGLPGRVTSAQTPQLQAQQQPQETSPQHAGVIRLHGNAFYFLTTARRVTSPTWGPPPPCKQALSRTACGTCKQS